MKDGGDALARAGESGVAPAEIAIRTAAVHLSAQRYAAAADGYRDTLRHDPRSMTALLNLGSCLIRLGKPQEAISVYESSLEMNRHPYALIKLSELLATSDTARAIALANEAVRATEGDEDAFQVLAVALYRAGQWQASLDAAKKARAQRDGDAPVEWLIAAMAHAKLGDADKAWACFDRGAAKATAEHRTLLAEAKQVLR